MVKNMPAYIGDASNSGSIPASGRSPGGENGNPLQYSCLGNPIDKGAWCGLQSMGLQSMTGYTCVTSMSSFVFFCFLLNLLYLGFPPSSHILIIFNEVSSDFADSMLVLQDFLAIPDITDLPPFWSMSSLAFDLPHSLGFPSPPSSSFLASFAGHVSFALCQGSVLDCLHLSKYINLLGNFM